MSEENAVYIRRGQESDLEAIARVLVDTWRTTFRGLLSDEFLDGLTYKHQEERHLRRMTNPRTAYFVAASIQTNEVIGFASGGPNRDSAYPYSGELYAIYICDKFQRRGIGKRLFCAIIGQLIESGLTSMLVWLLVNNPNSRFYERIGGRFAAERLIELGPDTVSEVALAWSDLERTFRSQCSVDQF
jgi:ribosomal protein S18 acetylase RimI-like enzyme